MARISRLRSVRWHVVVRRRKNEGPNQQKAQKRTEALRRRACARKFRIQRAQKRDKQDGGRVRLPEADVKFGTARRLVAADSPDKMVAEAQGDAASLARYGLRRCS
jgi:hypothetical protein